MDVRGQPAFNLAAATDGPGPEVLDAQTTKIFLPAFYNVGMQEGQLSGANREQHIESLVDDVELLFLLILAAYTILRCVRNPTLTVTVTITVTVTVTITLTVTMG